MMELRWYYFVFFLFISVSVATGQDASCASKVWNSINTASKCAVYVKGGRPISVCSYVTAKNSTYACTTVKINDTQAVEYCTGTNAVWTGGSKTTKECNTTVTLAKTNAYAATNLAVCANTISNETHKCAETLLDNVQFSEIDFCSCTKYTIQVTDKLTSTVVKSISSKKCRRKVAAKDQVRYHAVYYNTRNWALVGDVDSNGTIAGNIAIQRELGVGTDPIDKSLEKQMIGMCEGEIKNITLPWRDTTTTDGTILTYENASSWYELGDTLSYQIEMIHIDTQPGNLCALKKWNSLNVASYCTETKLSSTRVLADGRNVSICTSHQVPPSLTSHETGSTKACEEVTIDGTLVYNTCRSRSDTWKPLIICVNKTKTVLENVTTVDVTSGLNVTTLQNMTYPDGETCTPNQFLEDQTCKNMTLGATTISNTNYAQKVVLVCTSTRWDANTICTNTTVDGVYVSSFCGCTIYTMPPPQFKVVIVRKIDPSNCRRKTKTDDDILIHYIGKVHYVPTRVHQHTDRNSFLHEHPDWYVYDNSYINNIPVKVKLGTRQFMKGWDRGLVDMCEGEIRNLTIPWRDHLTEENLAYTESPHLAIREYKAHPPLYGDTLSFEILLVKIVRPRDEF